MNLPFIIRFNRGNTTYFVYTGKTLFFVYQRKLFTYREMKDKKMFFSFYRNARGEEILKDLEDTKIQRMIVRNKGGTMAVRRSIAASYFSLYHSHRYSQLT